MKGPKGYLSFSMFKRIIDEISEHKKTALVPFFRGESLLHPKCVEMLAYIKQKGIGPIQFTTNATLLTKDIALSLIDLELDFISFSVDSIDSESYGEIRRGGELKTVLNNIDFFCEQKQKMKMKNPEIQVSVVKTKNTSGDIDNFVSYWQQRVNRVRVYEEHSQNGNFGSLEQESIDVERKACFKPFRDMVIYWNGSVAICNHDWDRENQLGNIEENSIEEIWNSNAYKIIRDAHLGNGKLETLCENCDHWKSFYNEDNLMGGLYFNPDEAADAK